jgi:pimeloyl-ACP methyl ester carboxylesterase
MNLYFKETGIKNQETIIFLHGGCLGGWIWDEQVESFHDYHCIVVDLPEHGKSTIFKSFTIKSAAGMVVNLIKNHAHGGKAHLVGISLGAQIIVQILATHPDVVSHALITGTLIRSKNQSEELLKLVDYTFKVYEPVKDTRFFLKANMRMYNISKDHFDQLKKSTLLLKADSLHKILHENLFFTLPEGLNKADVPVLVMVGEKDYKVIKESVRDLVNALPNSKSYIVPKGSHVWNMESPLLFNKVLRSFISEKALPNAIKPLIVQ